MSTSCRRMFLGQRFLRENSATSIPTFPKSFASFPVFANTEHRRRQKETRLRSLHSSFRHQSFHVSSAARTRTQDKTPSTQCRLPSDFLSTIQSRHPELKISTNPYDLDSHGHGESYHPSSPPDAVIYPSSVEQIRDIFSLCCREVLDDDCDSAVVEVVSVIPYGAGTSVEGHLNMLLPTEDEILKVPSSMFTGHDGSDTYRTIKVRRRGGISIDMSNFQQIGDVGAGDLFVKVGAGVTRNTLNEALRHTGLQFMVDPGADASIGGMVACGASGTAAVKYGTMRENVLALTAVLPPTKILSSDSDACHDVAKPEIVHCGTTALKSSAGYNLTALLTGSEGTLGIVTECTVKLHPIHNNVIAAVCAFDDLHTAAEAVTMIRMMGIPVSRIELLDEVSVQAFNKSLQSTEKSEAINQKQTEAKLHLQPMELKPTLFMEFSAHSEKAVLEDLTAAQSICVADFNATNFVSASDDETRQALWAARHRLYYSSIALRSGDGEREGATPRSTLLTDACVPLSHFADILSATARDVKELGVIGPCFGHAGDGNFHCIMPMVESDTEDYRKRVFQVNENLIQRVISVGGTCTGEHGVGYGKKRYLERMYGSGGVQLMTSVKKALDPWNVMNPGKIVDV
ncbi:hypothetical protein HJC23_003429 [Cyclotella cryptica]|uniref:D-lactate dehydrogenase (cytochrome) n=1 Tax=Cyclotella cryptica TaxID=29204 RepID=A0ABD3QRZ3_9STRA